jgi:hypothetical protein
MTCSMYRAVIFFQSIATLSWSLIRLLPSSTAKWLALWLRIWEAMDSDLGLEIHLSWPRLLVVFLSPSMRMVLQVRPQSLYSASIVLHCSLYMPAYSLTSYHIKQDYFGETLIFSNQLVNPATSSPADDLHHYVIPPRLLLTIRFYFQQTSGIHAPVGKRKRLFSIQ